MEEVLETEFKIIEDEEESAEGFLRHAKIRDLMEVEVFSNPEEMINAVTDTKRTIKVFWIDINLGTGLQDGGLKMIEFLRPKYPDSLIIVYTAHSDFKDDCIKAGANHFFIKGQKYRETMAKINSIIVEFLDRNGLNVTVLEFDGEIAHIDKSWVKIECYKDGKIAEKCFPIALVKSALKENLRIDAKVRIKAIQQNASVKLTIEELKQEDDTSEVSAKPIRNLLKSKIWTNKLPE
jgi:ActR/RegA family two-component response regulator